MNSITRGAGFTLIELLVVVAVVSLLSSITLSSVNETRSKARDSVRWSNLSQVRLALELYKLEHAGYPNPSSSVCDSSIGNNPSTPFSVDGSPNTFSYCYNNGAAVDDDWDNTIPNGLHVLEDGGYVTSLPRDPINNGNFFYSYRACQDGSSYVIQGMLEKGGLAGFSSNEKINADVNHDGLVNLLDLTLVSNCFGVSYETFPVCRAGDLNHNGKPDMDDISIVQRYFTSNACD